MPQVQTEVVCLAWVRHLQYREDQLNNYLMWLVDRGISTPNFSVQNKPATNKTIQSQIVHAFGGSSPKIVFVGDGESELKSTEQGPLPSPEFQLITNIAKALTLGPEDFHYSNYYHIDPLSNKVSEKEKLVHRKLFVGTINRLRPAGVVILGAKTLNLISGKDLDFNSLRGKIINPELYRIPTIVTYHLRDMLLAPEHKATVWSDLNALKNHLDQIGH